MLVKKSLNETDSKNPVIHNAIAPKIQGLPKLHTNSIKGFPIRTKEFKIEVKHVKYAQFSGIFALFDCIFYSIYVLKSSSFK